jgi:hypothetical protein
MGVDPPRPRRHCSRGVFARAGENAELWLRRGHLETALGRSDGADAAFDRSLALARDAGDREAQVKAIRGKAFLRWHGERYVEASILNTEALDLDRQLGDDFYLHDW